VSGLVVDAVSVEYVRRGASITALDEVSLTVAEGEIVALVGESGSGKSTLARAVAGLVETAAGTILFDGVAIPTRGRKPVAMVFQDPLGSLDPRLTVAAAITEILRVHRLRPRAGERARTAELLELVGLPPEVAGVRPRYLSGGQQQRVAIARALASEPRILLLDEALSALDASVRAQMLRLIMELRSRLGIGALFIGHDLALVRQLADRVAVLQLGRLVEVSSAEEFFLSPQHPYSRELLAAVPVLRRT
jgi:ABC-type glutathione transport system ATPase component